MNLTLKRYNPNALLLTIIYTFGLLFLLLTLIYNAANGGDSWQQGDWLINNQIHPIRRGWLGSFFLEAAYYLKINPIYIVILIQGIIITFIFSILWLIGLKFKDNDIIFFLLISPIFIMYGFNDLGSSLRKEIIAYLAFTPLLIASIKQTKISFYITISIIIYGISVLSHEANIFFFPFYLISIVILNKNKTINLIPFFLIYIFISIIGAAYALTHSSVSDYMLVCKPILEAGTNINICNGAIKWLEFDIYYALEKTKELIISENLYKFFITYIFSIFIFSYLMKVYFSLKFCILSSTLASICFLPLYIIAIDWGRWINYYVSSLTFIILIWINLKNNKSKKIKLKKTEYIIYLLFISSWGVINIGGYISFEKSYIYKILFFTGLI